MRCLALAQAWQDLGGNAVFAMTESTASVDQRLRSEAVEIVRLEPCANSVRDARDTSALARDCGAEWVVVDGYQFDSDYQRNLQLCGQKVLLVDDTGQSMQYFADFVLNPNIQANEKLYRNRRLSTRLLLGPSYALLRREFQNWREWKREVAPLAKRVLIIMGGSDSDNVTTFILQTLQMVHIAGLEATDVAISAGGGTCYELALLQVPMLVITVAENQESTCEALAREEAAINLGWSHLLNSNRLVESLQRVIVNRELRQSLINNARNLVDGDGPRRILDVLSLQRGQPADVVTWRAEAGAE
jgi:spore coat polysaccharide biosynthesis predicted glycosyltransferase SpsG